MTATLIAAGILSSGFVLGRTWDFGEVLGFGNGDDNGINYINLIIILAFIILMAIIVIWFFTRYKRGK